MSAESGKEFVRRGLRAWNQNDWEAMKALHAPDGVKMAPEDGRFTEIHFHLDEASARKEVGHR